MGEVFEEALVGLSFRQTQVSAWFVEDFVRSVREYTISERTCESYERLEKIESNVKSS
jgi:hypothetical protein